MFLKLFHPFLAVPYALTSFPCHYFLSFVFLVPLEYLLAVSDAVTSSPCSSWTHPPCQCSPQMGSAGRRIVTTTTMSGGGHGGQVLRGSGIRRVVTAGLGASSATQDLPTVQLCDLPSNLTLSDINQIVADAGVGQPVVSTLP